MKLFNKLWRIWINKRYLGKTGVFPLPYGPTQKLINGWKGNKVANNMLKVSQFDISRARKGDVNVQILTNIELIKKTGLTEFTYLDVGCGIGSYVDLFNILIPTLKIKYTGIDYSAELINLANRLYGSIAKFKVGNMQNIPFKSKSFDVVCSSSVLPYSPDYTKAVSELRRVAKQYVLITRIMVTRGKEIFQKQKAYGSEWSSILFNEDKLKKTMQENNLDIINEIRIKKVDEKRNEKSYLLKVIR